jgi:DNA-binding NarL/FixJ family response regulator
VNILICDDHVVFADSFAHLIKTNGWDVVAVTYHPRDAIRVAGRSSVDVCVLDVMFGRDNVFGFVPELRSETPRSRLVVLTGTLDDAVIDAGRASGVDGFAEKTRSSREILAVIERVAAGETVIPTPRRPRAGEPTAAVRAKRLAAFLTVRERQVLGALVRGLDTATLANDLDITPATARSHIQSVLTKLNVHSRLEAATSAVRHGLVDPETGRWLV